MAIDNPISIKPQNIIFLGTPEFAVPTLEALLNDKNIAVKAVITQADKPAGRGQQLTPPPIKIVAEQHNIPVFQPLSLKTLSTTAILPTTPYQKPQLTGEKSSESLAEFLNSVPTIDALVTVAYGKILPASLVHLARCGIINIHPSALPRWRGAAPLQHTIFSGDPKTEICIMQADEGLDTGPVYLRSEYQINETDTFASLHDRFAIEGAKLLVEVLPKILNGELVALPQTDTGATYAEKWEKEDALINWADDSAVTLARIRASYPNPGARTTLDNEQVKVYAAHKVLDKNYPQLAAGTIVEANRAEVIISAGRSEFISLDEIQFPGKKRLQIAEILKGRTFSIGQLFGSLDSKD